MKIFLKRVGFLVVILMLVPGQTTWARGAKKDQSSFLLFSLLDGNRDGVLDPYEALDILLMLQKDHPDKPMNQQALVKILATREQAEAEEAADMLRELDKNGDQRTELSEIDPDMRALAALADRNKDGVLTQKELRDLDFADAIMMSEADIQAEVAEVFAELDEDRNKIITRSEAPSGAWNRLWETDADGDGGVSRQELQHFLTMDNTTARFEVKGDRAIMTGVIAADTPARVFRLVHQHPDIRIIEMRQVPGSIDDEANLRAARYIRHFGFTTIIRSKGMIASGGTDFFLAGRERQIEAGARLGIHSWGGPGLQGKDVPRDDPRHRLYLDYYEEMGIPAAFYWRTLEAAPADDIHWMTAEELSEYKCSTAKSQRGSLQ